MRRTSYVVYTLNLPISTRKLLEGYIKMKSIYLLVTSFALCYAKNKNFLIKDLPMCYGDLGCFASEKEFFDLIMRPINLDPQKPSDINTTFSLYTRDNNGNQLISRYDNDSISLSDFSAKKLVKFIVHGFASNAKTWVKKMAQSILEYEDVNVIAVDWSAGAALNYIQAVANTRVVGREIGSLILYFKETYNLDFRDVHIIGHSLGAHVAGYAGKWLNGTIGRISGLDPAGPFFQGMDKSVILDMTDAHFVDIIHTNESPIPYVGFGIPEAIGHFDFYPDGGWRTKSCNINNRITGVLNNGLTDLLNIVTCAHSKSQDLFMQSITSKCPFTAMAVSEECDSLDAYNSGKCKKCIQPGRDCAYMGYHADKYLPNSYKENVKYFLTTSKDEQNLCLYHWIVEIRYNQETSDNKTIKMYLKITGKFGEVEEFTLSRVTLSPSEPCTHLLELKNDLQRITSIEISWNVTPSLLNILSWFNKISIESIKLIPIDIIDQRKREENTVTFLGPELKDLQRGVTVSIQL